MLVAAAECSGLTAQIKTLRLWTIESLKLNGTLIFKWNEDQIKLSEILKIIDFEPLFGNKRSKTHWLVFMKEEQK